MTLINKLYESDNSRPQTFGSFIRQRREALGLSSRALALDLGLTPAYLMDIEKGNRAAPRKYFQALIDRLDITGDDLATFYDLAGKSRNDQYDDLNPYLGKREKARVALRVARDLDLSNEAWQEIILHMQNMTNPADE